MTWMNHFPQPRPATTDDFSLRRSCTSEITRPLCVISSLCPLRSGQEPPFLCWSKALKNEQLSSPVCECSMLSRQTHAISRQTHAIARCQKVCRGALVPGTREQSYRDALTLRASGSSLHGHFLPVSPFCASSIVQTQRPPGPHQTSLFSAYPTRPPVLYILRWT